MKMSKRFSGVLVLFVFTTMIYQNCGSNFSAKPASSVLSSSSSANGQAAAPLNSVNLNIMPPPQALWSSQDLTFSAQGQIPKDAFIAWSNSLVTTNGTAVTSSVCIERFSPSSDLYIVSCPVGGKVTVNLAILEQGQIVGSSSSSFDIAMAPATPTPPPSSGGGSPTPTPTPPPPPSAQYLLGASLYTKHCASCHADLSVSRQRGTIAASVMAGINGNIGGMGIFATNGPSPLSSSDIDAIVYALSHNY
jgi:hypothetical protein